MRHFKYFALILLGFALALNSCSDDNSSNPDDNNNNNNGGDDYFPDEDGSYWILDVYELDIDNNPVNETHRTDSMIVAGEVNLLGKEADTYLIYDEDNELKAQKYFYSDDSDIYLHSDFINSYLSELGGSMFSLPFNLGNRWIKIADFKNNSWAVFDTTFQDFDIFNGILVSGNFSVSGKIGSQKNITVGSQSYSSQEFILTFEFKGYVSIDPDTEKIFTFNIHHWFGKGVGLIQTTYASSVFDFGIGSYDFTGREEKVIRFNINN
jgi:hypothetical protein